MASYTLLATATEGRLLHHSAALNAKGVELSAQREALGEIVARGGTHVLTGCYSQLHTPGWPGDRSLGQRELNDPIFRDGDFGCQHDLDGTPPIRAGDARLSVVQNAVKEVLHL